MPDHIDALRRQGGLLVAAAERAGLETSVPPCPTCGSRTCCATSDTSTGRAARHIIECSEAVLDGPSEAEILRTGATDDELLGWFRAGHARLAIRYVSHEEAGRRLGLPSR
jgi:hypothetical protein